MSSGRPAEMGTVDEIFYAPRHPYTLGLIASLPRLDVGDKKERLYRIKGQPPSLIFVPSGCPFHPRCDFAKLPEPCASERPDLRIIEHAYATHQSACHFAESLSDTTLAELHAEVGAELDVVEDAAALGSTEAAAVEALNVPADGGS